MKRVGPLSCAKITGALYAVVGLVAGVLISLATMAGGIFGTQPAGSAFGFASILAFPVIYGVLGFLTTLLGAWLYNLMSGMVGGVEIDIQQD